MFSPLATRHSVLAVVLMASTGCATPQYAIRPPPVPDESVAALRIERTISAVQGKQFDAQGAKPIGRHERLRGLAVQAIVERLSRVTERPALPYRAYLYPEADPNAAALADGRIYLSTGMINYLAERGGREDELAFILGHELAHTVAQHLVKRARMLQQQQMLMRLVAAGASALTRNASQGAQQAGALALDAASMLRGIANSGYSQEQELEADQLGIRYVRRAGFDPGAALELLSDFSRFENPWPFLRTHPYVVQRREHLQRYLTDTGSRAATAPAGTPRAPGTHTEMIEQRRRALRAVQRSYPKGSVSWKNLQRQIEALSPPGAVAQ